MHAASCVNQSYINHTHLEAAAHWKTLCPWCYCICFCSCRNVTITSQNPKHPYVWDMQYKSNGIILCSTCTLVLSGIVIAHDRRGSGPNIDIFTGGLPANSSLPTILLVSSIRKRQACLESLVGVSTVKATPRSPKFPEAQQRATTVVIDFRGTTYNNSLWIEESAVRAEKVYLEGSGWSGGYDMVSAVAPTLCRT